MRWLRNEAEAGQFVDGIAPAVRFQEDIGEWLVVGFEHLTGRPADLAPTSADLSLVATTLNRLAAIAVPEVRPLSDRWKPHWWEKIAEERPDIIAGWDVRELTHWEERAAESVTGDRLVHTDLHEDQFIIDDDHHVHVIDWGWPASGAPWVDSAFMVIRLIHAGHSPAEAEAWARARTPWTSAADDAVTAFSVYVAGLWHYRATSEKLAQTARSYAEWRLASS
ncbi:hypothetical protein SAMN05421504_105525 [Amycolatopsis xylanica]|uniref:Aminoglycoside phosphotransferase domain-containing protein n=2 Tax=Amycolatopsis xylanica TaxID=589385 RepID=A0A1H3JTZ2_9PSEU|nr:hypothetical protein SAMN05421504_105525 [Amycolatopsis xylanica]